MDYDEVRELAKILHLKFFGPGALDWPPGDLKPHATQYLLTHPGIERVEWAQPDDDILLCLLWVYRGRRERSWIIEFAGFSAEIISIFEFKGEVAV